MFDTVLIANRGEIALRVTRACKELGLRTVAIYSEADRAAPHVAYADAAYLIGPPPAPQSYLDAARIIAAAREAGANAIHPGYGFLAENAAFARACAEAGLVFIGPPPEAMERMGGKVAARNEAVAAGVPLVPGTLAAVESSDQVRDLAVEYGYPVAIKAVGGGGGRGLRVVGSPAEADAAFASARREAESAFKNPELYVEKYLENPRHIEIQVLADTHGAVIHLGERDCSIQRRHQKLIEECPAPALSAELRQQMGAASVALARSVGYVGAGTLEFLFQDGNFYFLEMNTRIQVEHTVTEMVTGIDLVQAQLRIARGEPLWIAQDQVCWRGHAIECRINAEDPSAGFRPALGTITDYVEPSGFGVRVDSGARANYTIPPHYDSMIAKLVAWGEDRTTTIARMRRALADYRIGGVITTIPFHQLALAHPAFAAGEATVNFIPEHLTTELANLSADAPELSAHNLASADSNTARMFDVEVNGRRFSVRVSEQGVQAEPDLAVKRRQQSTDSGRRSAAKAVAPTNGVVSTLQGTIVAVRAVSGQAVEAGQVLFIVEAMKMENEIAAPHAGVIAEVRAQTGQIVEPGMLLAIYQQ
jgi:acetyl-CoA/propionyl-CoA carboxylase, biotin carboxylase, biotin carboxyl carrier protein